MLRSKANTELTKARPESSCLKIQDCISLIMVSLQISLPDPHKKGLIRLYNHFQWQIGLKESKLLRCSHQQQSVKSIVTICRTLAPVFYILHCCILCGQDSLVSFLQYVIQLDTLPEKFSSCILASSNFSLWFRKFGERDLIWAYRNRFRRKASENFRIPCPIT